MKYDDPFHNRKFYNAHLMSDIDILKLSKNDFIKSHRRELTAPYVVEAIAAIDQKIEEITSKTQDDK